MSEASVMALLRPFELLLEEGATQPALNLLLGSEPDEQMRLIQGVRDDLLDRVLDDLTAERRAQLLNRLSVGAREALGERLGQPVGVRAGQSRTHPARVPSSNVLPVYAPKSAGARMRTDFLTLDWEWTVDQAVEYVRGHDFDVPHPYYLYALDENARLIGVVSMRGLVMATRESLIADVMSRDVISVSVYTDQQLAAQRLRQHHLLALPVLDDEGRPLGIITTEDVVDIQVEEDTEDMFKMAGVGITEHAFSPVLESARRRVPWLAFNMAWAFAGAAIITLFQGTLERAAVVAVFMPMIAGQCGNAGIQTATIVVRSMALGELDKVDVFALLRKEWMLGTIKGLIFGSALGIIAWLWKGNATLGVIAGTAMLLNMLVASTAGVGIPLTLRRVGIDPATIAGVFDTMLTDFMGFLIYLGLATIFVSRLD